VAARVRDRLRRIILAVLFALAFILIQSFKHEAAYSFKHLEKTVAQCAAELGIEHGIYLLQQHKSNDYKTLGMQKSSLEINKKFGTSDEFEMELPVNCTDDEAFRSSPASQTPHRHPKTMKPIRRSRSSVLRPSTRSTGQPILSSASP
jgi:hypothetical protein